MITRRKFLRVVAGSLLTAGGGLAYARGVEPRWLAVTRIRVPLSLPLKATPALRILHLSDLHLSPVVPLEFIAASIARGVAEKPDLIAVTGDFFTGRAHDVTRYAETLARLSAAAPTFACLGNHDGGRWSRDRGGIAMIESVLNLLSTAGITCLLNESRALVVRGQPVQLTGLADLWSGLFQPEPAFAQNPDRGDAVRLVLNHNPDAKSQLRSFDWDVMLCGHTHGGQVRLPLIGAPFAPVDDKRYLHGLYPWDNHWLHITSGVGNLHGVRFNCRPEVSVLTLG